MNIDNVRRKFDAALKTIIAKKRDDNNAFMSLADYNNRINDVKQSKLKLSTAGSTKTMKDYRMVRKYDLLTVNGKESLIKPISGIEKTVLYYVTNEELFDIIHQTHLSIGHAGRNKMASELRTKYCNVTQESVMLYLRLCVQCKKKFKCKTKGLLPKPILDSILNSRGQVDLIDMQSRTYNDYSFVMVYQDDSTKFIILKALKTKSAHEIAISLLETYTTFGAPAILHSDGGQEFVNSILTELHALWDEIKIVRGKPRHSECQGSVITTNRDIQDKLSAWMKENGSKDWPTGLKFVQFQKNCALHLDIGKSPYEAMFGCPPQGDLLSMCKSHNKISDINSEEDIESMLANPDENSSNDCTKDINLNHSTPEAIVKLETFETFKQEDCDNYEFAMPKEMQEEIIEKRKQAELCLENQAEKMIKLSHNFPSVAPVPNPDVEPSQENLSDLENCVKTEGISVKAAVSNSVSDLQEHKHCNCKTYCRNQKCSCRIANKMCNSTCHGNSFCSNKTE